MIFFVVQSISCVQLFAAPWTASCQASLSFTISQSLFKLISIESVMPSNHLILCHPPFLLPSVFPSIRVFSSESTLHIRWPKYWSFNFSISLSSEYSGLISFGIGWFDLLAFQGHLRVTIIVFWNIDAPFKIQEFFTHLNPVSYLLKITSFLFSLYSLRISYFKIKVG